MNWAQKKRLSYLEDCLKQEQEQLFYFRKFKEEAMTQGWFWFLEDLIQNLEKKIVKYQLQIAYLKRPASFKNKITEEELESLRNVSIFEVMGEEPKAGNLHCPFHLDETPSFHIWPDNSWHCFGCGKHGRNAIDFLMAQGKTFKEAICELQKYVFG